MAKGQKTNNIIYFYMHIESLFIFNAMYKQSFNFFVFPKNLLAVVTVNYHCFIP